MDIYFVNMGELSYKLISINDFEGEKNNESLLLHAYVVVKALVTSWCRFAENDRDT